MYCANCGVKLADSENQCPLCATPAFHPNIQRQPGQRLYPQGELKTQKVSPWITMIIATTIYLLPMLTVLIADWQLNHKITWSGYVVGALGVLYILAVLPNWFSRPNPVIFVPVDFAAIGLYLLYINLATGGSWFLSFAFPVTGALGLIVTAVVTLNRYLPRAGLYIYGGASIALGGFTLLLEYLLHITFGLPGIGTWSPYPLIVFSLLGLSLLLIAICPPLRESLERKFFV